MDRFDISLNQWKGIRKVKSITKTVHFILYNNFVCSWSDIGFTYDCCQPIHIGYMGYCDGTAPFVLAMWTVVCSLSKLSGVGFVCFSWWLLCVCVLWVCEKICHGPAAQHSPQLEPPHGRPLGWLAGKCAANQMWIWPCTLLFTGHWNVICYNSMSVLSQGKWASQEAR